MSELPFTFQAQTRARSTVGGPGITWADSFTAWGKIDTLSGNEQADNYRFEHKVRYRFKIRYLPSTSVTPDMRIKYGSRYFKIEGIYNENEGNRWLIIDAGEVKQ